MAHAHLDVEKATPELDLVSANVREDGHVKVRGVGGVIDGRTARACSDAILECVLPPRAKVRCCDDAPTTRSLSAASDYRSLFGTSPSSAPSLNRTRTSLC